MEAIRTFLKNLFQERSDEKGQTVIEYILVIVLIALVLILAFRGSGVKQGVQNASQYIAQQLNNSTGP